MKCVYCNNPDSRVVDSRPTEDGSSIRRRRECEKCARRFTTYERVEAITTLVVKKDGRREPFDATKIRTGIIKACEKRPITASEIEVIISEIEMEINNLLLEEIPTTRIGEIILEKLKQKDEIAYVRFASVYREFNGLESFLAELNYLASTKHEREKNE